MTEGASHFHIETREQAVLRHSLGHCSRSFSYRVRYVYRAKTEDGENENTMYATCAGADRRQTIIG